jgi:hypothetical protein
MTPELGDVEGIDNSPEKPFYNEYGQIADPDIAFELALLEEFMGTDVARRRENYLLERFEEGYTEDQLRNIEWMDYLLREHPASCKEGVLDSGERVVVLDGDWNTSVSIHCLKNKPPVEEVKKTYNKLILTENYLISIKERLPGCVEDHVGDLFLFKNLSRTEDNHILKTNHLGSVMEVKTSLVSTIINEVNNACRDTEEEVEEGEIKIEVGNKKVEASFTRYKDFFGNASPDTLDWFEQHLTLRDMLFEGVEDFYKDANVFGGDPTDILNPDKKPKYPVVSAEQRKKVENPHFKRYAEFLAKTKGRYYADIEWRRYVEALDKGMTVNELFNERMMTYLTDTYPYAFKEFQCKNGQNVLYSDGIYFEDKYRTTPIMKKFFSMIPREHLYYDKSIVLTTGGYYEVEAWKEGSLNGETFRERVPLTPEHIELLLNQVKENIYTNRAEILLEDGVNLGIYLYSSVILREFSKDVVQKILPRINSRNTVIKLLNKEKKKRIKKGEQLPEILELL